MGFYGSVYYQLIDTFYKITGKNSGKSKTSFQSSTANSEIEATGRKGVINLDTGNRWINISKSGDSLLLTHQGTDNDYVSNSTLAIEVVDGKGSGSGTSSSPKKLNYEDVLKVSKIYQDQAGHVTGKKDFAYLKLPAEPPITDDLKSLQYYAGIRDIPVDPNNPTNAELTNKTIKANTKLYASNNIPDPKTNLYNYAIHNYEVAKIHKSSLHDWSNICDSYSTSITSNNNITICKAIGDLDNLFSGNPFSKYLGTNGGSKVFTNGLVSCIGNMSLLYAPFGKQSSTAFPLVDAIVQLKEDLDEAEKDISENEAAIALVNNFINEHVENSTKKFTSIETTIGTPSGIPIYTEISNLHTKDTEILGILGTRLNANLTAFGEISALQTKTDNTNKVVEDNKSALDKKDGELQKEIDDLEALVGARLNTSKTVFNEISDTNKTVEDNKSALDKKDGELQKEIDDLEVLVGTRLNTSKTVFNEISDTNKTVENNKIALDEEDDRLEGLIGDLNTLIGTQKTEGVSVFTEITNLNTLIGTKPDTSSNLYAEISNLNTLIGTKPDTSSNLYAEISNLNTLIGTQKTEGVSVFTEISNLNTLIGTQPSDYSDIFTEISSLKSYFSDIEKTTVVNEINARLTEELKNYVSHAYLSTTYKELTDGYYISVSKLESLATKAELESLATKAELENYILADNFSTLLDETIAESSKTGEDGQSTLKSLTEMSNKIVELEGKIEELEKQISDLIVPEEGTE